MCMGRCVCPAQSKLLMLDLLVNFCTIHQEAFTSLCMCMCRLPPCYRLSAAQFTLIALNCSLFEPSLSDSTVERSFAAP
jgi:hypothetical protein